MSPRLGYTNFKRIGRYSLGPNFICFGVGWGTITALLVLYMVFVATRLSLAGRLCALALVLNL
jgi:hypothetical protein